MVVGMVLRAFRAVFWAVFRGISGVFTVIFGVSMVSRTRLGRAFWDVFEVDFEVDFLGGGGRIRLATVGRGVR